MQLCRFYLLEDPQTQRSGIFHENRIYETDGERAIGVHELRLVRFLPPVLLPSSVRAFEKNGEDWDWQYRNGASMLGPLSEFDLPSGVTALDFRCGVAAFAKDSGSDIETEEANEFLLGYSLYVQFFSRDRLEQAVQAQSPTHRAFDYKLAIGPTISTPDQITAGSLQFRVTVNDSSIFAGAVPLPDFSSMLVSASKFVPIHSSDLLLSPPLPYDALSRTELNRMLLPGDRIQVSEESLGTLTLKVV